MDEDDYYASDYDHEDSDDDFVVDDDQSPTDDSDKQPNVKVWIELPLRWLLLEVSVDDYLWFD